MWQIVSTFDNLRWHLTTRDSLWWLLLTCGDLWQIMTNCDNLRQFVTTCGHLWELVMTFVDWWWLGNNCTTSKCEKNQKTWKELHNQKRVTDRQTRTLQEKEYSNHAYQKKIEPRLLTKTVMIFIILMILLLATSKEYFQNKTSPYLYH